MTTSSSRKSISRLSLPALQTSLHWSILFLSTIVSSSVTSMVTMTCGQQAPTTHMAIHLLMRSTLQTLWFRMTRTSTLALPPHHLISSLFFQILRWHFHGAPSLPSTPSIFPSASTLMMIPRLPKLRDVSLISARQIGKLSKHRQKLVSLICSCHQPVHRARKYGVGLFRKSWPRQFHKVTGPNSRLASMQIPNVL